MIEHTETTKAAYAATWSLFQRWATGAGRCPDAPVSIETLQAYTRAWPPGLGRSGRKLRLAGIAHGHAL
ncbi:hypothetical protein, partial [Endobacter medicaginis]